MNSEQKHNLSSPSPTEGAGNPYQAVDSPLAEPQPPFDDVEKAERLERYRSRIFALGVFWILIALFSFWAALIDLNIPSEVPAEERAHWYGAAGEWAVLGAIELACGALACRYHLWAVLCGLTITARGVWTWATAVSSIFDVSLGFILLTTIEIGQSLRVFAAAWSLYHSGVPLRSDPAVYRPGESEESREPEDADDSDWESNPDHPVWKTDES